ncbi:unnamed protein product [Nesidiocoris tenuis]|uniref:Uncharacterized protein n=1 Tax=Nesidiocoris tenuis TaxID=355587 RepID=A0A6H5G9B0_9HEMI|nr:unnamed protein product [Nesidiocoris tenuis]
MRSCRDRRFGHSLSLPRTVSIAPKDGLYRSLGRSLSLPRTVSIAPSDVFLLSVLKQVLNTIIFFLTRKPNVSDSNTEVGRRWAMVEGPFCSNSSTSWSEYVFPEIRFPVKDAARSQGNVKREHLHRTDAYVKYTQHDSTKGRKDPNGQTDLAGRSPHHSLSERIPTRRYS